MAYTTVSAPGKVLVAGGYLVLDRAYSALVVATSSRFYCSIRHAPGSSSGSGTTPADAAIIRVRAGQFPEAASTWTYIVQLATEGLTLKQLDEPSGRNKFIEITVSRALEVALEVIEQTEAESRARQVLLERIRGGNGGLLDVVVLADNDFYSQREQLLELNLPPLYSSLAALSPFTPLPRPIPQTNKTGLGSSAALVTSLTAALLAHLQIVSIPTVEQADSLHHQPPSFGSASSSTSHDSTGAPAPAPAPAPSRGGSTPGLDLIHNLSQLSHCLAQGKVGSGFDISSGVYGSHIYRRFTPSILTPLMSSPLDVIRGNGELVSALESAKWNHTTSPFRLPKGLRLMLADVDAGTDTPSFVGKVLQWRESDRTTADKLWRELAAANTSLTSLLQALSEMEGEETYEEELQSVAEQQVKEITSNGALKSIPQGLVAISWKLSEIRSHLREMSKLSHVPIEPPKQTRLLNECSHLPGVLGGGVPGAGGYDAIYLLVIDRPSVVRSVEKVWSEWTEMSLCPLSSAQSDGGLRLESLEGVAGLKERLGW